MDLLFKLLCLTLMSMVDAAKAYEVTKPFYADENEGRTLKDIIGGWKDGPAQKCYATLVYDMNIVKQKASDIYLDFLGTLGTVLVDLEIPTEFFKFEIKDNKIEMAGDFLNAETIKKTSEIIVCLLVAGVVGGLRPWALMLDAFKVLDKHFKAFVTCYQNSSNRSLVPN